jgi:hypothetical protein
VRHRHVGWFRRARKENQEDSPAAIPEHDILPDMQAVDAIALLVLRAQALAERIAAHRTIQRAIQALQMVQATDPQAEIPVIFSHGIEEKMGTEKSTDDGPDVSHARHELEIIGEEPETIELYLNIIREFGKMGHSGASKAIAIPVLNQLLLRRPLSPITDNPDEWLCHPSNVWDGQNCVWQNKRDSRIFSENGGRTYYFVGEKPGRRIDYLKSDPYQGGKK